VTLGTQTVGFLNLAISGLRAIGHPARAIALATGMIAVHASCPSLRTALTQSRRRGPLENLKDAGQPIKATQSLMASESMTDGENYRDLLTRLTAALAMTEAAIP
jgi:hypothetical protein